MAKKKSKELTTNKLLKILNKKKKEEGFDFVIVDFEGFPIKVKQYLDAESKYHCIDFVSQACFLFDDEIEAIQYKPIIRDVVFAFSIIKYYTDLTLEEDSYFKLYDLVYQSGLLDVVLSNIPLSEIEFLEHKIDDSIEDEMIFITNKQNSFLSILDKIINEFKNLNPNSIEELISKMKDIENVDILKGVLDGKI